MWDSAYTKLFGQIVENLQKYDHYLVYNDFQIPCFEINEYIGVNPKIGLEIFFEPTPSLDTQMDIQVQFIID